MIEREAADLSALPEHAMGPASPAWWGSAGYMLIEGTGFALVLAVYFYLHSVAPVWPLGAPPPDLGFGSWVTGLLIVSLWPNHLLHMWARAGDLRKVKLGLVVLNLFTVVLLVLRVFEFRSLNVSWDSNAYGSIVWLLLGLHTTHLLTDTIEWWVLTGVMFSRHGDNKRRYGDVQDNTAYWTFVVVTWLAVYGCIYGMPRL